MQKDGSLLLIKADWGDGPMVIPYDWATGEYEFHRYIKDLGKQYYQLMLHFEKGKLQKVELV